MIYKRNQMGIKERAELEAAKFKSEKTDALLQYVAMMADIELPTEEEESGDEGQD